MGIVLCGAKISDRKQFTLTMCLELLSERRSTFALKLDQSMDCVKFHSDWLYRNALSQFAHVIQVCFLFSTFVIRCPSNKMTNLFFFSFIFLFDIERFDESNDFHGFCFSSNIFAA